MLGFILNCLCPYFNCIYVYLCVYARDEKKKLNKYTRGKLRIRAVLVCYNPMLSQTLLLFHLPDLWPDKIGNKNDTQQFKINKWRERVAKTPGDWREWTSERANGRKINGKREMVELKNYIGLLSISIPAIIHQNVFALQRILFSST